jgi:hypothetical protein
MQSPRIWSVRMKMMLGRSAVASLDFAIIASCRRYGRAQLIAP